MDYYETDPEFIERFEHFAFDEVVNEDGQQLAPQTRYLVILATLIGCQATATMEERLDKGAQAQAEIFGEHMKEAWKTGHINRWLVAQGGCEPQLRVKTER